MVSARSFRDGQPTHPQALLERSRQQGRSLAPARSSPGCRLTNSPPRSAPVAPHRTARPAVAVPSLSAAPCAPFPHTHNVDPIVRTALPPAQNNWRDRVSDIESSRAQPTNRPPTRASASWPARQDRLIDPTQDCRPPFHTSPRTTFPPPLPLRSLVGLALRRSPARISPTSTTHHPSLPAPPPSPPPPCPLRLSQPHHPASLPTPAPSPPLSSLPLSHPPPSSPPPPLSSSPPTSPSRTALSRSRRSASPGGSEEESAECARGGRAESRGKS